MELLAQPELVGVRRARNGDPLPVREGPGLGAPSRALANVRRRPLPLRRRRHADDACRLPDLRARRFVLALTAPRAGRAGERARARSWPGFQLGLDPGCASLQELLQDRDLSRVTAVGRRIIRPALEVAWRGLGELHRQ